MYMWNEWLAWLTSRICANLPNRYFHFSIFHLNLIVRRNKKKISPTNTLRTRVTTKKSAISQCLKWNVRWRKNHAAQYFFFFISMMIAWNVPFTTIFQMALIILCKKKIPILVQVTDNKFNIVRWYYILRCGWYYLRFAGFWVSAQSLCVSDDIFDSN